MLCVLKHECNIHTLYANWVLWSTRVSFDDTGKTLLPFDIIQPIRIFLAFHGNEIWQEGCIKTAFLKWKTTKQCVGDTLKVLYSPVRYDRMYMDLEDPMSDF